MENKKIEHLQKEKQETIEYELTAEFGILISDI